MLQALENAPTESPWGPHIWFSIAGRDEMCAVPPRRLVHGGGSVGWQSLKQVFFTTRLIEAFDEGFNLVVDEREYGRLLDHRYQVDWAEQWETAPLDELQAALERFPTSRMLRWKLGERTKRKPTEEVLELLRTSARDCGDDVVAKEMIAAGEEKFHDGDLRAAARILYRALVVDPSNVNGWCDLGVVWNALGRFEAVQAFERALTLDPEHCDTLLNRADWAMDRGLKGLAGSDAERVIAVEPDNESAHDILARTDWLPASALQR
jgi:tetratricopeptide (TPR) repeat protein